MNREPVASFDRVGGRHSLLAAIVASVVLSWGDAATAATLVVDESTCTLVNAIHAANTDTEVGGCPAGHGADVIHLVADVLLTEPVGRFPSSALEISGDPIPAIHCLVPRSGPFGLPSVRTKIEIVGVGRRRDISRVPGSPSFAILPVAGGRLRLENVRISNGEGLRFGGVAIWAGRLVMRRSELAGNLGLGNDECGWGTLGDDLSVLSGATAVLRNVSILGDPTFDFDTPNQDPDRPAGSWPGVSAGGKVMLKDVFITGSGLGVSGELEMHRSVLTKGSGLGVGTSAKARIARSRIVFNAGHGIMNRGSVFVSDSTIEGNIPRPPERDYENGGGIWNSGVLHVVDSVIRGNWSEERGGGIYTERRRGFVRVQNTTIEANHSRSGGGLYSRLSTVELKDVRVIGNEAWGTAPRESTERQRGGAGVFSYDGLLLVERSTILDNRSESWGGGLLVRRGKAFLLDSTVARNTSVTRGGGIATIGSEADVLSIVNTTLSGNSSRDGGAISIQGSRRAHLTNSTLAGNFAEKGAGLFVLSGGAILTGSLLANGEAGRNCVVGQSAEPAFVLDEGGNLADDRSCKGISASLTGLDPKLTLNAGGTLSHRLLPGSSAIEAIELCVPATDQAGRRRPDRSCDAGAVELGGRPIGPVFRDDFEIGSTDLWSHTAQGRTEEKNQLEIVERTRFANSGYQLRVALNETDNRTYLVSKEPFEEKRFTVSFMLDLSAGVEVLGDRSRRFVLLEAQRNKHWLPGGFRVVLRTSPSGENRLFFIVRENRGFRRIAGGLLSDDRFEIPIAVTWTAAASGRANGTLRAMVDNKPFVMVDDLDNSESRIGSVRFGLVGGDFDEATGSYALDDYVSFR